MVSLGREARRWLRAESISLAVPSKKRPQPEMNKVSLQEPIQVSITGQPNQQHMPRSGLPCEDVALVLGLVLNEVANVILGVARGVQRRHVEGPNLELVVVLELECRQAILISTLSHMINARFEQPTVCLLPGIVSDPA